MTTTKQRSNRSPDYVEVATHNGVTTITMNNPAKLNGWTLQMMQAFKSALAQTARNDATKAVIFTGAGDYYSAGVNLAGTIRLMHPAKLHRMIVEHNQGLFDAFLDFPKPILAAVNGPAIGASVTTATLCNAIIASERATFSTPFAALRVPPEGCSSVHFERIMGKANATRMLGSEGWKPTGSEALEIGLVQSTVQPDKLLDEAQGIAEKWVTSGEPRRFRGGSTYEELKAVNAAESIEVANAFLSAPFLKGQFDFLWGKKKRAPAIVFLALWLSRPLWALLLR